MMIDDELNKNYLSFDLLMLHLKRKRHYFNESMTVYYCKKNVYMSARFNIQLEGRVRTVKKKTLFVNQI